MTGAGDLRTRVTFQQLTETPDGYGGRTKAWSDGCTVHCQYIVTSGREQLKSGRLEASVTATLRCRALAVAGVDEGWRAVIDGTNWNIRSVMAFGQRGEWKDMIIERAGAGVAV